jgi:hypothetical protein
MGGVGDVSISYSVPEPSSTCQYYAWRSPASPGLRGAAQFDLDQAADNRTLEVQAAEVAVDTRHALLGRAGAIRMTSGEAVPLPPQARLQVSLSDWLAHSPPLMVAKRSIDPELSRFLNDKPEIVAE